MGGVSHITSPASANLINQGVRDRIHSELSPLIEEPPIIPQRSTSHQLNIENIGEQ